MSPGTAARYRPWRRAPSLQLSRARYRHHSFCSKIEYHRTQLREQKRDTRDCKVRYAWAREVGERGRSHYHLVILLNHDAYHRPGRLQSTRRNLVSRLEEAWASALGLSVDQVQGLVNITDNATCRIYRDVPGGKVDELPELFRRASYLCKVATKSYGDRQRGFDTSRGVTLPIHVPW